MDIVVLILEWIIIYLVLHSVYSLLYVRRSLADSGIEMARVIDVEMMDWHVWLSFRWLIRPRSTGILSPVLMLFGWRFYSIAIVESNQRHILIARHVDPGTIIRFVRTYGKVFLLKEVVNVTK
jgi:hypothetical protein